MSNTFKEDEMLRHANKINKKIKEFVNDYMQKKKISFAEMNIILLPIFENWLFNIFSQRSDPQKFFDQLAIHFKDYMKEKTSDKT